LLIEDAVLLPQKIHTAKTIPATDAPPEEKTVRTVIAELGTLHVVTSMAPRTVVAELRINDVGTLETIA
jgi:hypothetical protein